MSSSDAAVPVVALSSNDGADIISLYNVQLPWDAASTFWCVLVRTHARVCHKACASCSSDCSSS